MTISQLVDKVKTGIIEPLIAFLFVAATLVFLWGIINYVIGAAGDEERLKHSKTAITWGIIGMFIMSSAWGIVKLLCQFFESCPGSFP